MLVLGRRTGERILIGDDIDVTVVRIGSHSVRLGIEAPKNVRILRPELAKQMDLIDEALEPISNKAG